LKTEKFVLLEMKKVGNDNPYKTAGISKTSFYRIEKDSHIHYSI
jgi:hypothetical protein